MDSLLNNLSKKPEQERSFWAADDRLERIAESAMDAVLTMSLQGEILDWNKHAETIFGWTREEALGKDIGELIVPPQYRSEPRDKLLKIALSRPASEHSKSYRMLALRRSGEEFPIEFTFTDFEWSGQRIFNVFIYDVTSLREVERQGVREKLETALLQHMSKTSLTSDTLKETLAIVVPTLAESIGWEIGHAWIFNEDRSSLISSGIWYIKEGVEGAPFQEISEQNQFAIAQDLPGLVWEKEKPVWVQHFDQNEHILRKLDENKIAIKSAFAFPVIQNRKIVAILEFFRDYELSPDLSLLKLSRGIGEHIGHSIERMDLLAERMRFAAIVKSSGDAIIGKTLDGTITSWNQGAQKTYGWAPEEVIGKTVSLILLPGMAHEESEILEATKTGRLLDQFQTRRRRKDGTTIDVSVTVSPIRGLNGRVIGSSTIERDITAQKNREIELLKARDAAEQASKARGEFLASVSHELRTPMNAILGMLELTLQEDLPEMIQDYLETAKDSADSLLLLVNDILDLSRLDSGRFELEPLVYNVRGCLDDAMKTLSLRAHEKGVELVCHIHSDVPDYVIGDPVRVRQIMLNLVGNALKFTQQGEVVVVVSLAGLLTGLPRGENEVALEGAEDSSTSDEHHQYYKLEISVSDTGIGIAPEDQKRIFEPFTQVDASTTRKYSGTGLGLTICQELIGLMNGKLQLESTVGEGSQFSFSILQEVPPEDDAHLHLSRVTVDELNSLPVLIVDDNKSNQIILKEMLSNWSMKPETVDSAVEAIERLRQMQAENKTYPLLIIDAMMPEMDGFMFLQEAKKLQLLKSATIVMLSSADQRVFGERAEGNDIAAFLEKPVSQSDLLNAIMTVLRGPELRASNLQKYPKTPNPLNILVAEDTPANQKVIKAILNKRGHESIIANNGREAVEYLINKHNKFDIVLMDIQMPTMDGFQATRIIREHEEETGTSIPIIAMTAFAMKGDKEKCLEAGMDDYISKPLDAVKLIRLVEKHTSPIKKQKRIEKPSRMHKKSPAPESTQVEESNIIDMDKALRRLGGDHHILNSMITYFYEDGPELLTEIKENFSSENCTELTRAAHSLKGLCANFEGETAASLAAQIESRARKSDLINIDEVIAQLEVETGLLTAALKKWQKENL
ncbi:MAG: response regulator [Planctomycetaceae bacterium]